MKFLFLLFFVMLVHFDPGFAQNDEFIIKDRASFSKIDPILQSWQNSDNPNEFAENNGFLHKEGKIQVYIHLASEESILQIPSEINVMAIDGKIIVAFVDTEQLDELEKKEFIERITPPDLARTPPLPIIEPSSKLKFELVDYDTGFFLVVFSIILILIFTAVFFQKRRKHRV